MQETPSFCNSYHASYDNLEQVSHLLENKSHSASLDTQYSLQIRHQKLMFQSASSIKILLDIDRNETENTSNVVS